MTPEQTRAIAAVCDITNNEVRSRAVMLILANNIKGLTELRRELFVNLPSIRDWDCARRAVTIMQGKT
jgi:hypothetical protein